MMEWRCTLYVATVPLCLSVLIGFSYYFAAEKAFLWHTMRSFGRAPPDLAPPARGTSAEFLAQNLDLARPQPRLSDGSSRVELGAMRRSDGQNAKVKFLVACLLLACLSLAWLLLYTSPQV